MREKWNKEEVERRNEGQPIPPQRLRLFPETYRPKLLSKVPSMRAISNYNNISTENENNSYDNLCFIPESGVEMKTGKNEDSYASSTINSNDYYSYTSSSNNNNNTLENGISLRIFNNAEIVPGKIYLTPDDVYDYTTIKSSSIRTSNGSEIESEKYDLGSTVKLVSPKVESSCRIWFGHLETILCTISLATGFGNLYRLPQVTLIWGGLPFLVAYIILTALLGFPLLFLELGIGQLAQEGFIKTWRAVPFFKGVGYVKLIAGCLLTIYYPLYMGLCLYYIIWLSTGPPPFAECAVVKIKETGYKADGISGQQCLQKTFLESPYSDPSWYGIYAAILFLIWIVIMLLSLRRTKSYVRSLSILLFPTFGCLLALIVKAVYIEEYYKGFEKLTQDIDWTILQSANIWYYAMIQVFFSTNIGFGTFVTNAGIIYNKVNPFWMAVFYVIINIVLGVTSVILTYVWLGSSETALNSSDISEVHLLSLIYDSALNNLGGTIKDWTIVIYVNFLCCGFISMVTLIYTLLKVLRIETGRKFKWQQASLVLSFLGFILGTVTLLSTKFKIVHLFDHYIVGNLILISVIIEVLSFIIFYGPKRIIPDFEFMMGRTLSKIWILLWWIAPVLSLAIFIWALSTVSLTGIMTTDPEWLYGIGWAIIGMMLIFIVVIGFYTVSKQDEYYTFADKFASALKPSRKWGPTDPILRHTWIQWHSKAKEGERDFTLKRRGTREYTHSVKKRTKKSNIQTSDENSIMSASPTYNKNDQNQNNIRNSNSSSTYVEPYYLNNSHYERPLRITSLVDSLDPPGTHRNTYCTAYRTNLNPLARPNVYNDFHDGSNSEGYGTFRKGPYIINDNVGHVCYRKYSQSEDATEL